MMRPWCRLLDPLPEEEGMYPCPLLVLVSDR